MGARVRAAVLQLRSGLDPRANRLAAESILRTAVADGAQFVATPECTPLLDRDPARLLGAIHDEANDPEVRAWGRLAAEHGVWLLLGSAAVATGDGKAANRSLLYAPNGKIAARYDKIHLFDVELGSGEAYRESATFKAGVSAIVAAGPSGAAIGLSVCYDLRFPHLYRALAQAGADIITIPAAFTRPTGQAHWEVLLRARAIETGAYVLAPAQGGKHEDGRSTFGASMIVDPWGAVVARLEDDAPGYVLADLDMDAVADARRKIPAWSMNVEFAAP